MQRLTDLNRFCDYKNPIITKELIEGLYEDFYFAFNKIIHEDIDDAQDLLFLSFIAGALAVIMGKSNYNKNKHERNMRDLLKKREATDASNSLRCEPSIYKSKD